MQGSSILCCSSNSLAPVLTFSHRIINPTSIFAFSIKSPSASLNMRRPHLATCYSTVCLRRNGSSDGVIEFSIFGDICISQEVDETTSSTSGFVETGYVCGVHGFEGDVRIKPTTDFPELRFSKSGTKWLKQQASGNEILQEVELVEGRDAGKFWIVRFKSINTFEQAQKLVGSTVMVTDVERPILEEGEFYTRDLIGMTVILKETGEPVGTVSSVFNSGASDLLRVKLDYPNNITGQVGKQQLSTNNSGPLVWVPFVEAIVPYVDLERREMFITPPKGLLELNVRSDERSKKERRELEWKERKKFQRQLISAKKKLCVMEQQHVFHGFRCGEKEERNLLADQIVAVNSKLLQQALQSIGTPSKRLDLLHTLSTVPRSSTLRVRDHSDSALDMDGQALISKGKVVLILVLDEMEMSPNIKLKELLHDQRSFVKVEDRSFVPLVLIGAAHSVGSLPELFSSNDYFGFDPEKVWFLEEEKLPVVTSSLEEGKRKILMKSPWEFLQRPLGSGGVLTLLSSQDSLLDELSERGVEYIEVCNVAERYENRHALVGLVARCEGNVGIHLFDDVESEDEFDVILSMSFLRTLVKQVDKLRFFADLVPNSYVEKVDKDWVDVNPSAPNSYEFRASIYSCLDSTPMTKVCVLDSRE